jgi:hypothetical protein
MSNHCFYGYNIKCDEKLKVQILKLPFLIKYSNSYIITHCIFWKEFFHRNSLKTLIKTDELYIFPKYKTQNTILVLWKLYSENGYVYNPPNQCQPSFNGNDHCVNNSEGSVNYSKGNTLKLCLQPTTTRMTN